MSICEGQTVTLTASGATNYVWSNGENNDTIFVNPTENTTYTVTGTTSGCTSLPSSVTVSVNPIPKVSVENQTICEGQTAILTASGATNYVWNNGENSDTILVNPTENTTYTVTGTSSGFTDTVTELGKEVQPDVVPVTENTTYTVTGTTSGCTSLPSSVTVSVNPVPKVSVENQTICEGQTATLTASGATTYIWSNGETGNRIFVNPSSTTTYHVTGTSLECTSSPITAMVNVNPVPSDSILIIGNSFQAVQLNATYQWLNCSTNLIISNETNQIFEPKGSGSYAVIVSNGLCSDTSKCFSMIISGLSSISDKSGIEIFPNPTTGILHIKFSSSVNEGKIVISNKMGMIVMTADISNNTTVEIDNLIPDVYLARIILNDKEHIFKIAKL